MGFKIRGAMKVLEVAGNQKVLDGFKVTASKNGADLAKVADSLGLKLEAAENILYFRCKMLGYDFPNGNGDAVPRIYAANFGPSFIGKPLDVNHQTDPEHVIGKILTTFHVEQPITLGEKDERIIGKNILMGLEDVVANELQLEGICMIDRTTVLGDDIAKKLLSGVLTMVSQEAATEYAECTVCGHRIDSPYAGICAHLDFGSLMIKAYPVEGKKHPVLAYKNHQNPSGTGLGVVTVGAYSKADVLDMVASLKSGKIKPAEAVAQIELQERVYGASPLLIEASKEVMGICASLGVSPTVAAALKKLDGLETVALMKEFGKIKADSFPSFGPIKENSELEILDEDTGKYKPYGYVNNIGAETVQIRLANDEMLRVLPGDLAEDLESGVIRVKAAKTIKAGEVKLDKAAQPTPQEEQKSESATASGEALGVVEDAKPVDVQQLIDQAVKDAAKYVKDVDKEDTKKTPELKAAKTRFPIRLTNGKWRDVNGNSYDNFEEALEAEAAAYVDGDDKRAMDDKMMELGRKWKGPHGGFPEYLPMSGRWRDVNGNSYDTYEECEEASVSNLNAAELCQCGAPDDRKDDIIVNAQGAYACKKCGKEFDPMTAAHIANFEENEDENDVTAAFYRNPDLAKSYWLVSDKNEKVLGRFTLAAIAGGQLNREITLDGKKVSLSQHLQSEDYGRDLVAHVKKSGAKKVLGILTAAEGKYKSDDEIADEFTGMTVEEVKLGELKEMPAGKYNDEPYKYQDVMLALEFPKGGESVGGGIEEGGSTTEWASVHFDMEGNITKISLDNWYPPKVQDAVLELVRKAVSGELKPGVQSKVNKPDVQAAPVVKVGEPIDPTPAIEQILSNDEASSDEELVQHFIREMGLSETDAQAWVAKRGNYLLGILEVSAAKRWGKDKNGKTLTIGSKVTVTTANDSLPGVITKIDSDGSLHVEYEKMASNGYGYGEHSSEEVELDPNVAPGKIVSEKAKSWISQKLEAIRKAKTSEIKAEDPKPAEEEPKPKEQEASASAEAAAGEGDTKVPAKIELKFKTDELLKMFGLPTFSEVDEMLMTDAFNSAPLDEDVKEMMEKFGVSEEHEDEVRDAMSWAVQRLEGDKAAERLKDALAETLDQFSNNSYEYFSESQFKSYTGTAEGVISYDIQYDETTITCNGDIVHLIADVIAGVGMFNVDPEEDPIDPQAQFSALASYWEVYGENKPEPDFDNLDSWNYQAYLKEVKQGLDEQGLTKGEAQ